MYKSNYLKEVLIIAENTVISPNFMVWKFCGKAQFPYRNYAFPQNFHTMKLGEITVFYAMYALI